MSCISFLARTNDLEHSGWAGSKLVYANATNTSAKDGWVGWQANDEAIFKLESTCLKMYHKRLERTFKLQLPSENLWKVHLSMHDTGNEVEVLMPTYEEVGFVNGGSPRKSRPL